MKGGREEYVVEERSGKGSKTCRKEGDQNTAYGQKTLLKRS